MFSKCQQVVVPFEAPSSPAPPRGTYSAPRYLLDVSSAQAAVGAGFVGSMFDLLLLIVNSAVAEFLQQ